jgi:hypothetical protein
LVEPVSELREIGFDLFGVGEGAVDVVASDVKHLGVFLVGVAVAVAEQHVAEDVYAEDEQGYCEYFSLHLSLFNIYRQSV